jgi:predicted aldo/keto reductase-like oxidoreductase
MMTDREKKLSRREFLERGAASAIGVGVGLAAGATPALTQTSENTPTDNPSIADYRRLGRTEYKVSDLGFGNAYMQDTTLLEYAIERGINYVDTARQYYDMEKVLAGIFPQKRDKIFLTTKLMPELVTADVTVDALMAGLDESLERLNTDMVDCCLIHSIGDPELGDRTRVENENIYTMFEKARQAGKIRFWGASGHGPKIVEEFAWLIENTNPDVIMPGMNYMTKGIEPILAKAKAKDIAVVAMKSMSAARKIDYSDFASEGRTVRQALLKWMLAQPNIDTISITMRSFEDVDEFVSASGKVAPTPKEEKAMEDYGLLLDRDYCRPGCDSCLGSCPHDVPIHDIMRYGLYFNNYGQEKHALERYAAIPVGRTASNCASCDAPCTAACPFGCSLRPSV